MANILDDLDDLRKNGCGADAETVARAVRRMKRDRHAIRRMEGLLRCYNDIVVTELKARLSRED